MNNTGKLAAELIAEPRDIGMPAFDQLPRAVRDALNYAVNPISAVEALQAIRDYKIPERAVVRIIERADRIVSAPARQKGGGEN